MSDLQKEIAYEMLLCSSYGCKQFENYNGTAGQCDICKDDLNDTYVLKTPCGHYFHWRCIYLSLKHDYFQCIECNEPFEKTDNKINDKIDSKEIDNAFSYYS